MADVKATVTANVDCTAVIQAELVALLFELIGDLRERCKQLEAREVMGNSSGPGVADRHSDALSEFLRLQRDLRAAREDVSNWKDKASDNQDAYNGAKFRLDEANEKLAQVTTERDAAREQHLTECRKYSAEVERRLALEKQVAELSQEVGQLPAEPAPEPYPWQVGDEIIKGDGTRAFIDDAENGSLTFSHRFGHYSQEHLESDGWKLFRKASDPRPSPQQATEPISDSVGTDGEGQP